MPTTIFTTGYEQHARPEDLVAALVANGVDRLVDVRELPLSRRGGCSKTASAAANCPMEDASFDGAVSNFGIIYASDSRSAVDEIERTLALGGVAAVTECSSSGFMGGALRSLPRPRGAGPTGRAPTAGAATRVSSSPSADSRGPRRIAAM